MNDADEALTQTTRTGLFGLLSELKRAAGTAELAERPDLVDFAPATPT